MLRLRQGCRDDGIRSIKRLGILIRCQSSKLDAVSKLVKPRLIGATPNAMKERSGFLIANYGGKLQEVRVDLTFSP